jgi:hypothetical protein
MSTQRLSQLEENLDLLREQLAGLEKTKALSPMEEGVRLGQRIKELKKEIQAVETDYWQTAANSAGQLEISEPEAEVAVGEIVEAVTQIEAQPVPAYSAEIVQLLRQIRDQLNQPGSPAAAKLKGTLSSFPPFVGLSYEAELDTENFFRTHFPTFTRLIKGAAKK